MHHAFLIEVLEHLQYHYGYMCSLLSCLLLVSAWLSLLCCASPGDQSLLRRQMLLPQQLVC